MKKYQDIVIDLFAGVSGIDKAQSAKLIEFPPKSDQGDRAIACFAFAKAQKKSPAVIASTYAELINQNGLPNEIEKVISIGGYVNFYFAKSVFAKDTLETIFKHPHDFEKNQLKEDQTAVIEFSSPNIAKPFSIGHLRSTNLGACLSRIYAYTGWKVEKINHLGDWGTQFGKLITAYKHWGNAQMLDTDPIDALFKLYVQFHDEEKDNPSLTVEARQAFSDLEKGDENAKELWTWFRNLTLKELDILYKRLGVEFDHLWGESFYIDQLGSVMDLLKEKKLSKQSDGALIVDLKDHNLNVAVLQKGDESSLYITRDLAAAIYRFKEFAFSRMVYVVGSEQSLHFQQLFKILDLAGHGFHQNCQHVAFGQITFGTEKMSTRKGNVVFLKDVLARASTKALEIVSSKNPDLENASSVADDVALGAIIFADISAKRIKNVKFDWDEILSFEGETGPYLQYTYVRTQSLIKKFNQDINLIKDYKKFDQEEELALIRTLSKFSYTLDKVIGENEPFYLGRYLMDITKDFNRFYQSCRIMGEDKDTQSSRMLLVLCTSYLLKTGMDLLGIPTPEKM